jgi:hypothetical protein
MEISKIHDQEYYKMARNLYVQKTLVIEKALVIDKAFLHAGLSLWTSSGKITSKDIQPSAHPVAVSAMPFASGRPLYPVNGFGGRHAVRRTSAGSLDAFGHPADADIRTHDNPACMVTV